MALAQLKRGEGVGAALPTVQALGFYIVGVSPLRETAYLKPHEARR